MAGGLATTAQAESILLTTKGSSNGSDYTLTAFFEADALSADGDGATGKILTGTESLSLSLTVGGVTYKKIIDSADIVLDLHMLSTGTADVYFNAIDTLDGGMLYEEVGSSLSDFVSLDQDFRYLVGTGDFSMATTDFGAGPITNFGGTPSEISLQMVPEPAAVFLLGVGLTAIGFMRRRKTVLDDAALNG
jgi:hypothetical protein